MVTLPLDPSHLALDPVDMDQAMDPVDMDQVMDLDLDLAMAVLAVYMDPTWEHCSLMVSDVKVNEKYSMFDDIEIHIISIVHFFLQ